MFSILQERYELSVDLGNVDDDGEGRRRWLCTVLVQYSTKASSQIIFETEELLNLFG